MNNYEGRPTDAAYARTNVLNRQLNEAVADFQNTANRQLPELNRQLAEKNLPPIQIISETNWQKANDASGGSPTPTALKTLRRF